MSWKRDHLYEDVTLDERDRRVLDDLDAFAEPELSEPERHWPASSLHGMHGASRAGVPSRHSLLPHGRPGASPVGQRGADTDTDRGAHDRA